MLDLICRRYPGTRPSSFLDLDDDFVALQVDYAIARKHLQEDYDYDGEKLDAIQNMLKPLGAALGIEYKESKSTKNPTGDDIMDLDDALMVYGTGPGTIIV